MFSEFQNTVDSYLQFYEHFLQRLWYDMNPTTYAVMLLSIATIGWLLMKSSKA